jgi:uncharacterized protein (TIGR02996 family)
MHRGRRSALDDEFLYKRFRAMTDEDAFIRAIQADPEDTATRLVYADWLEERGQTARAEHLRRWAEKGQHPPMSFDRSWTDLVAGRVLLWDSPTLLALGRLEGLLRAYSQVNEHSSDISYDFVPKLVRPAGLLADQVSDHFPECYHPVSLERVLDWEATSRDVLTRWMFDSLNSLRGGPLIRLAFLDERRRGDLVDALVLAIEEVIQPRAVWRIQVTVNGFYAIAWDDFVLEADDRLLFLHFSFSD